MLININDQELGNILAGLVLLQNHVEDEPLNDASRFAVWELATKLGDYEDLTREELIQLAFRLTAQADEQSGLPKSPQPRSVKSERNNDA